jgi:hypothetical protein
VKNDLDTLGQIYATLGDQAKQLASANAELKAQQDIIDMREKQMAEQSGNCETPSR